jgi:hypothetical protein
MILLGLSLKYNTPPSAIQMIQRVGMHESRQHPKIFQNLLKTKKVYSKLSPSPEGCETLKYTLPL